jgi:hypothetical protein
MMTIFMGKLAFRRYIVELALARDAALLNYRRECKYDGGRGDKLWQT